VAGGGVFSRQRWEERPIGGGQDVVEALGVGFWGKKKSKQEGGRDWRWFREEGETLVYLEKKGVKRREEKERFLGGRSTVGDKADSLG